MMEGVLFYILATVLVFFSILTVVARNPVRSALYLISALLSVAGLFFLQEAEFVGAVQVLVYVGGIMVLFLFVIMLVSVREVVFQRKAGRQWKAGVVLALVMAAELVYFLINGVGIFQSTPPETGIIVAPETQNTETLGRVLYGTYLLPFEIASILLLVAIIGAVVLSKKEI
ncbi:MAG: NADH-quinone oxidoreductase subunit J [Acidobacteria bacterium]|nr:NADH-quinone oxidoreductase subunit J [Acidobacteriota bacterium]